MRTAAVGIVFLASLLAGCQTIQHDEVNFVTARLQPIGAASPQVQSQFYAARRVCLGEARKAASGLPVIYSLKLYGPITEATTADPKLQPAIDVLRSCLKKKGYLMVGAPARVRSRSSG